MSAYDILITLSTGIITVSGAIAVLWKILSKNIKEQSTDLIDKSVKEMTKKFSKDLDEIKEKLDEQIKKNLEVSERVDNALLAVARDRINSAYEYYMRHGCIDRHTMFTLEEVYKSCIALDKNEVENQFVLSQMQELRELYNQGNKHSNN